jgi:IK cytokine
MYPISSFPHTYIDHGFVQVDAQRRYLGGDSDHSILVKGLDFALLEQNRARLASVSSKQDDEALEDVFMQAASTSTAPPLEKRSRADIIKELKEKRTNEDNLKQPKEEAVAENRPDSSKFRPIGFKPIGASATKTAKKKGSGEPKKKKRKVEHSATNIGEQAGSKDDATPPIEKNAGPHHSIEPEPVEDDFDIFADAGEYKGIDLGSDDDNSDTGQEEAPQPGPSVAREEDAPTPLLRDWFGGAVEPEAEVTPSKVVATTVLETRIETEEEPSATLVPLVSSAMPSIREFLAMDEAVEKEKKRKARNEKRKGKTK